MFDFIQAIPFSFAALFPVVNPLGSAVIFLSLTAGASAMLHRSLALKVAINTFFLLVIVLLTGTWILHFFGISVSVVQIGGGLVVAYIGWTLLNQPLVNKVVDKVNADKEVAEMAFFPLTMPITAGPGSIAVAITVGAHEFNGGGLPEAFWGEFGSIVGILLVAITVFLCYRYATIITHRLSPSTTQVIVRLAAFINLCIGLEIIWHGIQGLMM
jgi:multiple antibiotic resistance protein